MTNKGFIYILTNPSFPDYVKIGYAHDVEKRLQQLNRSECIPFAFRVYALYEVEHVLADKQIHKLLDSLNPDLRSVDTFAGKERVREFYAISAEEAYSLLECIAVISGTQSRLRKTTPTGEALEDEAVAKELEEISCTRRENFNFAKCGIPVGAKIHFIDHPDLVATVLDERFIEFEGRKTSLSRKAQEILQANHPVQGILYWVYEGTVLSDLRAQKERQGLYEVT